jgi:hypothetical protein
LATPGIYQDVHLHEFISITRFSSEYEKENSIQYPVRYLEERFLHQRNTEKYTKVFYTFAWSTGSTLEDFGVNEILPLAQHFIKQLSASNVNDKCKEALCNE